MKTWNIIYRDPKDQYTISDNPIEGILYIPIDGTPTVIENVFRCLKEQSLYPSENVVDFLKAGIAVYSADQLVDRSTSGYYNWSRHFKLHIPVKNIIVWEGIKQSYENLLSFLSGDKWELVLRPSNIKDVSKKNPLNVDAVCLMSGGLDSYIGGIDLLSNKRNLFFVGHHKTGSGELSHQSILFHKLKDEFKKNSMYQESFYVQPQQNHPKASKEPSSRARSIIFIALGLAVANSLNDEMPLYVPENGFISLNVPLSSSRLGSLSTRTTHPYVFRNLHKVLIGLDIKNPLLNPYQFQTKGEMIIQSNQNGFIKNTYSLTMSCAHPDVARWHKRKPGTHCGYCTPCIIRRAALLAAGVDDAKDYVIDIRNNPPPPDEESGLDLRAFKLSLEQNRTATSGEFLNIFSSGPLYIEQMEELSCYKNVYQKGLMEVRDLLQVK